MAKTLFFTFSKAMTDITLGDGQTVITSREKISSTELTGGSRVTVLPSSRRDKKPFLYH